MPSAKQIADEAKALLADDPNGELRRISIEAVLGQLFKRLHEHPREFNEFGRDVWDIYEDMLYAPREVARFTSAGTWEKRNVSLNWGADSADWRWPPQVYTDYDAMYANHTTDGIRVLGECWGMSKLCHPPTNGGVLLTGDPNGLRGPRVEWAPGWKNVRCLLGATFDEVHDFVDADWTKVLPNQPGYSKLTIAGTIGTGGHGSGLHLGPLASMVTKIEIGSIKPGGAPLLFERGAQNDDEFWMAVNHLGRLGPVVSLELELEDRFRIAEQRELRVLGSQRPWALDLADLIDEAVNTQTDPGVHSADIWLTPYAVGGELTAAYGVRRYTQSAVTPGKRPAILRSEILQTLGQWLAVVLTWLPGWMIKRAMRLAVEGTETPPIVMESREGLDFGAANEQRMASIEMAFDISTSTTAAAKALETIVIDLENIASTRDRYLFSPIGIRFVGESKCLLSPQAGNKRTMHVELPTFAKESRFHGDDVLRPMQETLAKAPHNGRPHWGQRVYLSGVSLRPLFPQAARFAMRDFVRKLPEHQRFANEIIDPFLEI